jgi:hypothetical protein
VICAWWGNGIFTCLSIAWNLGAVEASEAARCWAEQDGAPPLAALMDQAVTTFEPLLEGLG